MTARLIKRDLALATGLLSVAGITWYASTPTMIKKSHLSTLPDYPSLSDDQVQHILTSKESCLVPRDNRIIKKVDFNSVASNNPIEDYHAEHNLSNGSLIAVFDGHGGTECAELVSKQLASYVQHAISTIPESSGDERKEAIKVALKKAFLQLDQDILQGGFSTYPIPPATWFRLFPAKANTEHILKNLRPAQAGSCAIAAYIENNDLFIACTGDSRAVLGRARQNGSLSATELSQDQTTKNSKEYTRLLSEHPNEEQTVVVKGRVLGGLMPTRAFGDARYKWPTEVQSILKTFGARGPPRNYVSPPYVTAEPEVSYVELNPETDKFLILATDGLWDELSSEEAMAVISKTSDENKASGLIKRALGAGDSDRLVKNLSIPSPESRRFRDDVTVSVVHFGNIEANSVAKASACREFKATTPKEERSHSLPHWLKLLSQHPRSKL